MKDKSSINYLGWGITLGVIGIGVTTLLLIKGKKNKNKAAAVDLSVFDSPDIPGSGACMDPDFIAKLQEIEKISGLPIFDWINSGARSESHNRKVGGVKTSAHRIPICKAADIHVPNKEVQDILVKAAVQVGLTRIGIGKTFVHLDNDSNKPQWVSWGYPIPSKPPYNPFKRFG